jgi:microsomal dipeptidase-like Zn-dependent dipeptidase
MPSAQQTLIAIPVAVVATAALTWAIQPAATLAAAPPAELSGWVDLHTHPMVNLAFGGKLVYGGVDVGSLMPTDVHCNHNVRASSWQEALSDDRADASGPNLLDNQCGDEIRKAVIQALQGANDSAKQTPDHARGADDFRDWPAWNDITHQKMWVDWIRRAVNGGQRVMVALAVNNKTLADAVAGPGDFATDDKASTDLQITEIKSFVGRHNDFMEVAYSPADLHRIVSANKLAVIVGVEVDNFGNFNTDPGVNEQKVSDEIDRLYSEGVRYIFPIHVLDNVFGGTAVYTGGFNLSNYREEGHFWDLTCSHNGEQITYRYTVDGFDVAVAAVKAIKLQIDLARNPPDPPTCPAGTGHVNTRGLTALGTYAINTIMKKGMLIDIDHMSRLSADSTIALATAVPEGGYPLISGHNGMRGRAGQHSENARTSAQLTKIAALKGMFGLGTAHLSSYQWISNYAAAVYVMRTPGAVAMGTDLNGLVVAPGPRAGSHVAYSSSNPMSSLGSKQWNYNSDGVAHYGLLADFLQDARSAPGGNDMINNYFMHGAEYFYQMWLRAETQMNNVGKSPAIAMAQRVPVPVVAAGSPMAQQNAAAIASAPPTMNKAVVAAPVNRGAVAVNTPSTAAASAAMTKGAPAVMATGAMAGPQLTLRISQGPGTSQGTWYVIVTAVDSVTGALHPGTIQINGVKGTTGQRITFKECTKTAAANPNQPPRISIVKCEGNVAVANYPNAVFWSGPGN